MRRVTSVVLLVMTCLALMAAPALAQRDPFDPLIDPNAVNVGAGGATTGGDTTGGSTVFQPTDGSDVLANTGSDVSPWMAVAYALIVTGAGAVVIARMHQPQPIRRR